MNYADINESLEDIVDMLEGGDSLNEEALVEQILAEAHDDLVDLMESVGFTLETETAEEALEAVSEFMESAEFLSLSEKEQQKVKAGWKMVFGKLQKLGKDVVGAAKSGELSQAARETYRSAKGKLGKAMGKTKMGKALDKAGAKFGQTKVGSALAKMGAKSAEKRMAGDAKRKQGIKDYWKKNAGK